MVFACLYCSQIIAGIPKQLGASVGSNVHYRLKLLFVVSHSLRSSRCVTAHVVHPSSVYVTPANDLSKRLLQQDLVEASHIIF